VKQQSSQAAVQVLAKQAANQAAAAHRQQPLLLGVGVAVLLLLLLLRVRCLGPISWVLLPLRALVVMQQRGVLLMGWWAMNTRMILIENLGLGSDAVVFFCGSVAIGVLFL
jgi:hypothetical protein